MRTYSIKSKNDLSVWVSHEVPLLQKEEYVFVEIQDVFTEIELIVAFNLAKKKTKRLVLSLDSHPNAHTAFKMIDGRHFLVRLVEPEVKNSDNYKISRSISFDLKSGLFKEFKTQESKLKKRFSEQIVLIPEIVLDSSSLTLLSSAILSLLECEVPFVFINPLNLSIAEHSHAIKKQLDFVRIYAKNKKYLYFSIDHPYRQVWNASVKNIFSGPSFVDIDISNVCTHNCVFCGLYNDEAVRNYFNKSEGQGSSARPRRQDFYKKQVDKFECIELIKSLPETIKLINFGGAGDPFTHPNMISFISAARERNFPIKVFTNCSYFSKREIDKLHSLAKGQPLSVTIIANVSGATAEVYCKTRPNQSSATFSKVLNNIQRLSDLFLKEKRGVCVWLMCVTNGLNFRQMSAFVLLAREIGAYLLWIKPMEVHGKATLQYQIKKTEYFEYAKQAKLTLWLADKLRVHLKDRHVLESIVLENEELIRNHEKSDPFSVQIEKFTEENPLAQKYLNTKEGRPPVYEIIEETLKFFPFPNALNYEKQEIPVVEQERLSLEKDTLVLGTHNASDFAYYDSNPCNIGYQYMRVKVDGDVLPCCISEYPVGTIKNQDYLDVWRSDSLSAFRSVTEKIHLNKLHRNDPEWVFCQQCPHIGINREFNKGRQQKQ